MGNFLLTKHLALKQRGRYLYIYQFIIH